MTGIRKNTTLDDVKQKIDAMLAITAKSDYECWEDAHESIMEELTEKEQSEHGDEIGEIIEQWWIATDDDENIDDES